ncbi:MAG: pyruvate, phosphate dikinase [Bdellovibrionaceae bacterium]|nr:pyruvate, phosphate dikinase [Bdellovibrionales bacterium]MCB9255303.1 pyruvate, phosphate dikinase [Pseudobdellovibrionaceae bacterium]
MGSLVYYFGDGSADGKADMRNLLGGKGANLAEMTRLGLPVPPGFTVTTEICTYFYQNDKQYPEALKSDVAAALKKMEKSVGAEFGSSENPLLVSVRSGARVSMPGMMDTILNLGLNDATVKGLAAQSGDERFAFDAYRRFIQMYADVVLEVPSYQFETVLTRCRREAGVQTDAELSAATLKKIVAEFKDIVSNVQHRPFPESVEDQLWGAMGAVFGSWMSNRAKSYRRINSIPEDWGTAVNVQAMVFGNMGNDCATGVAFTRDPSTGEKRFFGEFLPNAQGEDVVAGIRTPQPINAETAGKSSLPTMEKEFPKVYAELVQTYQKLEKHYRDMQDIEFTVQKNKLYLLQTRTGKRTASAAVRIAVDMVNEKLISEKEAILRINPQQVEQLLHPRLDPRAPKEVIAKGLAASPGAASGEVVFSSEDAEKRSHEGVAVILVRHETSPEDIAGMDAAKGVLTALGGLTSHAAVVARGMGRPCVAGCGELEIDYGRQIFTVGGITVKSGDQLTIDGATGEVFLGHVPTINSQVDEYFGKLMKWVDGYRRMGVRANAETPNDVRVARQFGAEGVGLCRTEHMFFGENRISAMREMILAMNKEDREIALAKLFPMQKEDFREIFRAMKGFPVTIRLLDPPLHEFLPHEGGIEELASTLKVSTEVLKARIRALKENNPMLGHRGCRLAISYPEIYEMQARAIVEAAAELHLGDRYEIQPEIMIPFVSSVEELRQIKKSLIAVCDRVLAEKGVKLDYSIGTMIEIPRAALLADEIASEAEFFSFGTNDLTQMSLGLSRDDAGSFLPRYVDLRIFAADPFVSLDQSGVGQLVQMGLEKGRSTNPKLKAGICGEHGGDPQSIAFCQKVGLDYVSCSPFRVPVARLAAAQAALR